MAVRAFITIRFHDVDDDVIDIRYINCDGFKHRWCSFNIEGYSKISIKFTSDIDTEYSDDEGDAKIIIYMYKDGEPVETFTRDCYEFERSSQLFDVAGCYRVEIEFLPE